MNRREFLGALGAGAVGAALGAGDGVSAGRRPNLVFVFADQWRAQAFGFAGDPNARTPHLDRLAGESLRFTHAVSGCPVCSPYRASLLTGQYWLTHGIFMNDVPLRDDAVSFAEALSAGGYDTAYIGKWHLDGRGRSSFIPPERRQGFDFWRVQECTHDYNNSHYYADDPEPRVWPGYDAEAQTEEAGRYISGAATGDRPFALFLSWGPPHDPYDTAPAAWREGFRPEDIVLRPNVPEASAEEARRVLAGYYAHCAALDACMGRLTGTLESAGIADNTLLVFTSDHGDMLGSQGMVKKQKPFDESIRVPLLARWPERLGRAGRDVGTLVNTPDLMPTVLGLLGVAAPEAVEGADYSAALLRGETPRPEGTLLACVTPFGEWTRERGGREYRGVRTARHTYVRGLEGPWLLFDNESDPHQMENLCGVVAHAETERALDRLLSRMLAERGDDFLPGDEYVRRMGYVVDKTGTVAYKP